MNHIIILAIFGILGIPSIASANPMIMNECPYPYWRSWIILPSLLFFEGYILAWLAKKNEPYRARLIIYWFFITLFTWVLFDILLAFLIPILRFDASIAIAEVIIILIEASIIWLLLRSPRVVKQNLYPPSALRSFVYSTIINMVSYCGSIIAFFDFRTMILS
jgi:hypothetical protein